MKNERKKGTRRLRIGIFALILLAAAVWGLAACPCSPLARPRPFFEAKVQTVSVGDATLAFREIGKGPPLLMIMAFGGAMDIWPPRLVETLARERRLILFDNRGVGLSTATDEPFSIPLFAKDALGLLDALKIEKADVFGWSMGSLIAQEMALARPEKVGKLILFGSAPNTKEIMKALAAMDKMAPEAFVAQLFPKPWAQKHPQMLKELPMLAKPINPSIVARQRKALGEWRGSETRLGKIDKETLLIVGEEDAITPSAQSLAMAGQIGGAWVARFKGAGHWLMYQNPDDLARLMLSFLKIEQDLSL